jgi:hypothetical protein
VSQSLKDLRTRADELSEAFERAAVAAGYADHWSAYRADMKGEPWPPALTDAHREFIDAQHAFYRARDGVGGFLGSRGV